MDFPTVTAEAAKAAPPLFVTYALAAGEYVAPWITILTFIYIILQIVWLIVKMLRKPKAEPKDDE